MGELDYVGARNAQIEGSSPCAVSMKVLIAFTGARKKPAGAENTAPAGLPARRPLKPLQQFGM